MIRNILTTLIITILFCINAQAHIDIVYPTKKELTINGDTTFISGNTNSNAELEINGEPVKLWDSGFFVHVVDLDYGINKIKIIFYNLIFGYCFLVFSNLKIVLGL